VNPFTLIRWLAWLAAAVLSVLWLASVSGVGHAPSWVPPASVIALVIACLPLPVAYFTGPGAVPGPGG
jgi:hypothetical protein